MATVTVSGDVVDVPRGSTIEGAMRSAGYTPDSFVYLAGGAPVPMDTVPEGDVTALRVASGG